MHVQERSGKMCVVGGGAGEGRRVDEKEGGRKVQCSSIFSTLCPSSSRKYLIQALSEEDRKSWLEIMEGKEPVYTSLKVIERNDKNIINLCTTHY